MRIMMILLMTAAAVCACGTSGKTSRRGYDPDEQVNLGYGSVSKDELTYSVNQLNVDDREVSSYGNIWDYMRSKVPGVEIGPATGGGMPSIVIRGKSSLNASNEPLILLDGMETNDISTLSPSDVASISVLKDASASIYGSRGANGVILITTKSAKIAADQEAAFQREAKRAAREAREARRAARAEKRKK